MLNIIRTNGTQYQLPRNTLEKIGEQESCDRQQPVTSFCDRNLSVTSPPPLEGFKPDNPARDRHPASGMSVIEVLESVKCVVCHDIYEQTILERSCEQALCLNCHEQIVKNECPACKREIQLIRLSRDSAKTVTRAIIKCNLRGGTKSAEVRASADKHTAFYAGRYRLRDPATFKNDYDLANLPNESGTTLSDVDSNAVTDQSLSSMSPGEDNNFSDAYNAASEVESDDNSSDSEPDHYSSGGDSSGYLPDGESNDHSSGGDSNGYSSDAESVDHSSGGDSNGYSSDGASVDHSSNDESNNDPSDGEPDDHPSQSNAAETDGSIQPLKSIREYLSGVLSSVSHFVSRD